MDHIVAEAVARQRFSMVLLGVFAGVALLLASVGIYGVMVTPSRNELARLAFVWRSALGEPMFYK